MHVHALTSHTAASLKICFDLVPVAGSVYEVQIPKEVIWLGPPVGSLHED